MVNGQHIQAITLYGKWSTCPRDYCTLKRLPYPRTIYGKGLLNLEVTTSTYPWIS